MKSALRLLHKLYKTLISPLIGETCRFHPSCSDYALEALESHGAIRGTLLTAKRICKCHPWSEGYFDPVPTAKTATYNITSEVK